jgi:hypothetical protein
LIVCDAAGEQAKPASATATAQVLTDREHKRIAAILPQKSPRLRGAYASSGNGARYQGGSVHRPE